MSPQAEVALALGYAGFLVAVAEGVAGLARRTSAGDPAAATWPRSDVARFRAGLGAALVLLAAFVLIVVLVRDAHAGPRAPLALGLGAVAVAGRRSLRRLRPAGSGGGAGRR